MADHQCSDRVAVFFDQSERRIPVVVLYVHVCYSAPPYISGATGTDLMLDVYGIYIVLPSCMNIVG